MVALNHQGSGMEHSFYHVRADNRHEEGAIKIVAASAVIAAGLVVAALVSRRAPTDAPIALLQQGLSDDAAQMQQTLAEPSAASAQSPADPQIEILRALGA